MELPAAAPLTIWPPLLAAAAPGTVSEPHRHHNLHLVLARAGTLRVQVGGESRAAAGLLTGPDVEHAVDASGCDVLLLFVDPESVPGARLAASIEGGASFLDDPARSALLAGLPPAPGRDELSAWAERAISRLAGGPWELPRMHPRAREVVRAIRDQLPDREVSLERLAERVGLSPSRLLHVFTASVGIPIRPYVRWVRFQLAATAIVAGTPLSEAAAAAGFADAAHMTRTFKEMFGLTPSALQRRSRR
ncbi:helix-turn-helix domain-containing protein [Vulgatibacter sp.]|uniref:helix-turn-helix domain-containing protein n=1 Tax=Vulgatibacter sp. TaxID=1971226 RepID=UPI00356914A3